MIFNKSFHFKYLREAWVSGILAFASPYAFGSADSLPWMTDDRGTFSDEGGEGSGASQAASLTPQETYARTQFVLRSLGLPSEPDSRATALRFNQKQTEAGLKNLLKTLDPTNSFARYSKIGKSGPGIVPQLFTFLDADSRSVTDFNVTLAPDTAHVANTAAPFHHRIRSASLNNLPEHPLLGLKIAIDPGHMGSEEWDKRTGKWIKDERGTKLSEGTLALQVAYLLEEQFTEWGAEVKLTHRDFAPVAKGYRTFDLIPYAQHELRGDVESLWFNKLLSTAPMGPALVQAFATSAQVKELLQPNNTQESRNRDKYFVLGADLDARAEAIEKFDADIALIIHFDAQTTADKPNNVNPASRSSTKVYVVGANSPSELVTRADRLHMVRHALDQTSWDASLRLGRSVVQSLQSRLGIPFSRGGGGNSTQVEPGIFARNLSVSRKTAERAVTYIECLHYSDQREFAALSRKDHKMLIDGKETTYSDRLKDVADSIALGVSSFVADY